MNLSRSLLAAGLIVCCGAKNGWAQQHHHPTAAHPAPPLVSVPAEAPTSLVSGGGWVRFGVTNTYIPSYLLGTPGLNYQAATSAHIPGGLGVAFPFVGVPLLSMDNSTGQPGPGGLMLFQETPTASPASSTLASSTSPSTVSRSRSTRADDLLEMGDRSFRSGNYRRADERYQQALRSQGESPDPHIRLAQISVVRGDYSRASAHLREAVASAPAPGWLLVPHDIQAMFGEPGDFARQVAHLESYLQAHPQDRNAWFVLGAEQHLSGRHQQAYDTFLRLTDRPADPALAAFLDATTIARRAESSQASAATPSR